MTGKHYVEGKLDFIIDTNVTNSKILDHVLSYAHLAKASGFRDIRLIVTPLLMAEVFGGALVPELMPRTKRYTQLQAIHPQLTDNIFIPPPNNVDTNFIESLGKTYAKHLPRHYLSGADRGKLNATIAMLKSRSGSSRPFNIDALDFCDKDVIAGLHFTPKTHELITPHIRELRRNSADYSLAEWFTDTLCTMRNHPELDKNYALYCVSNDVGFKANMEKNAFREGFGARFCDVDTENLRVALTVGVEKIRHHMEQNHIHLPWQDMRLLDRLEGELSQPWKEDKMDAVARWKDRMDKLKQNQHRDSEDPSAGRI